MADDAHSPRSTRPDRPPSIDRLARTVSAATGLPHGLAVTLSRDAVSAGSWGTEEVVAEARRWQRQLLMPVINATGVLLHSNLGRAPLAVDQPGRATTLEFDLDSGERGSRQRGVGSLLAALCGSEAAMVVNNNAAAVMLAVAALAGGRHVAVSRGESVEIGGGFRVPEVIEASGATLIDVGTTNRTRLADYRRAVGRTTVDVAALLKVHPSNYRIDGFVEGTSVAELASLGVPVIADIGSGLIDANCPWLPGPPPPWLGDEPAVRQTLEAGAGLVTFSGDKLFGGPQAGIVAGRADLVERCLRHPLARALRPGVHVIGAVQRVALAYLGNTVVDEVPLWRMIAAPLDELRRRAAAIAAATGGEVVDSVAVPGAGSAPGVDIPSVAVRLEGDWLAALRAHSTPVIGRVRDRSTLLDMRSVDPADDATLIAAVLAAGEGAVEAGR